MSAAVQKIGVLTGGGDAPGLNAVIRAVVKTATNAGVSVLGLENSFDGLIYSDMARPLGPKDVTGILRLGGTILGTVNRGNPFAVPIETPEGTFDYADRVLEMFHKTKLDALVCIGGDGTLGISYELYKRGIPLVCVPKPSTTISWARRALRFRHRPQFRHRRHRPAAHDGRGAPARDGGRGDGPQRRLDRAARRLAGGADVILIPKSPSTRQGRRKHHGARPIRRTFSIVVVAEGAVVKHQGRTILAAAHAGHAERLGDIGQGVRRREWSS